MVAASGSDTQQTYLVVRIGRSLAALDIHHVKEVLALVEISPVPAWDRPLLGVINARGTWLPIADIGPRLGFGEVAQSALSYIVVVTDGAFTVGLLADAVQDIYALHGDAAAMSQDLPDVAPGSEALCAGLIHLPSGPVPVLADVTTLLRPAERAVMLAGLSPESGSAHGP